MTDPQPALAPGEVVWIERDPTIGREQGGRRPALVIAGDDYLATVYTLAIVVPITTVDRRWPNHIAIVGADLPQPSWAMSEQVRTISRERVVREPAAQTTRPCVKSGTGYATSSNSDHDLTATKAMSTDRPR